jgi:hypothetical protein
MVRGMHQPCHQVFRYPEGLSSEALLVGVVAELMSWLTV